MKKTAKKLPRIDRRKERLDYLEAASKRDQVRLDLYNSNERAHDALMQAIMKRLVQERLELATRSEALDILIDMGGGVIVPSSPAYGRTR